MDCAGDKVCQNGWCTIHNSSSSGGNDSGSSSGSDPHPEGGVLTETVEFGSVFKYRTTNSKGHAIFKDSNSGNVYRFIVKDENNNPVHNSNIFLHDGNGWGFAIAANPNGAPFPMYVSENGNSTAKYDSHHDDIGITFSLGYHAKTFDLSANVLKAFGKISNQHYQWAEQNKTYQGCETKDKIDDRVDMGVTLVKAGEKLLTVGSTGKGGQAAEYLAEYAKTLPGNTVAHYFLVVPKKGGNVVHSTHMVQMRLSDSKENCSTIIDDDCDGYVNSKDTDCQKKCEFDKYECNDNKIMKVDTCGNKTLEKICGSSQECKDAKCIDCKVDGYKCKGNDIIEVDLCGNEKVDSSCKSDEKCVIEGGYIKCKPTSSCGDIPTKGCCDNGVNKTCVSGKVKTEQCQTNKCGWAPLFGGAYTCYSKGGSDPSGTHKKACPGSSSSTGKVVFEDNFNGSDLNGSKWSGSSNGYIVANGWVADKSGNSLSVNSKSFSGCSGDFTLSTHISSYNSKNDFVLAYKYGSKQEVAFENSKYGLTPHCKNNGVYKEITSSKSVSQTGTDMRIERVGNSFTIFIDNSSQGTVNCGSVSQSSSQTVVLYSPRFKNKGVTKFDYVKVKCK